MSFNLYGTLKYKTVIMGMALLAAWVFPTERAQADDESSKAPDLHNLAHKSQLIRAKADYSDFKFCPPGDKVIQQPENERLLFKRPDGSPDGYAQRRGNAIFYYDRYGVVSRVQALDR